jgi:hypothetical protein
MLLPNSIHYQFIKPVTWDEVFEFWRINEEANPAWIAHWKSKGFTSWEDWRRTFTEPWHCETRPWELYRVVNPSDVASDWRGGPFRTWRKFYYQDQDFATFKDIVTGPNIQTHPGYAKMLRMYDDFPGTTTMSAFLTDQGIVIAEGMHRGCALALAALNHKSIKTEIYLAVADARGETLTPVGQKPEESGI